MLLYMLSYPLYGQDVPEAFHYQAVIRDVQGNVMGNAPVAIRICIIQGSASASPVYKEIFQDTTNRFGLVNLCVGRGTPERGDFKTIRWGTGKHFIQVEVDSRGDHDLHVLGTTELLSVPYALHAKTVENDQTRDADSDPANELQKLVLEGNILSISRGNSISLPVSGEGETSQKSLLFEKELSEEEMVVDVGFLLHPGSMIFLNGSQLERTLWEGVGSKLLTLRLPIQTYDKLIVKP